MSLFKTSVYRSEKYRKFIKQQPCMVTEYPVSEPHHIKGHGLTGGIKSPDWAIIPLSQETHKNLHDIGYNQWEAVHGSQLEYLFKFWRDNFDEIMAVVAEDYK